MVNGILYRKIQLNGEPCHQLLLPATLKMQVLQVTLDIMGHQACHQQKSHECPGRAVKSNTTWSTENFVQHKEEAVITTPPGAGVQL